jgi:hypothetical protein
MSIVYHPKASQKPLELWKITDLEAELMRVSQGFDELFNETVDIEVAELTLEYKETGRVKYRCGFTESGNPNYSAAAFVAINLKGKRSA